MDYSWVKSVLLLNHPWLEDKKGTKIFVFAIKKKSKQNLRKQTFASNIC
jgi:hypothetical protein